MGAQGKIDVGPGYDRLAEAMKAEDLFQVRYWRAAELFTVELNDKRRGQGPTIRAAIEEARSDGERMAA